MTCIALIPARSGSRRVPKKNVRRLGPHPLIAYSIAAALGSGIFDEVVVSTDDPSFAAAAEHYGASIPFLRPAELATDDSPDIGWVRHALEELGRSGRSWDHFSILRPTSPFRLPQTIRRAWASFDAAPEADSIRAVEPVEQHPGKMWRIHGGRLIPVLPVQPAGTPWHSRPTQSLPDVYIQNASLEIARTSCVMEGQSISGEAIVPFLTQGHEGFDVNTEIDWLHAERLLADSAPVPDVTVPPWGEQTDG